MRILLAVSKNMFRSIIDALSAVKPTPKIIVTSDDEDVEVLSLQLGYEYKRLRDIEVAENLTDVDIAILALDNDYANISLLKQIKGAGIPIVIAVLHNKENRATFIEEGASFIIDVDSYLQTSITSLLLPDTWITVTPITPLQKFVVAVYRVLRRGLLGISINDVESAVKGLHIYLEHFNRFGTRAENPAISPGDFIIVAGLENDVKKAINAIEMLFRKVEEMHASRISQQIRLREYG